LGKSFNLSAPYVCQRPSQKPVFLVQCLAHRKGLVSHSTHSPPRPTPGILCDVAQGVDGGPVASTSGGSSKGKLGSPIQNLLPGDLCAEPGNVL
jgi:hypothetical protein